MKDSIIKKALIDSIPVLSGYVVLGIGFGVVLSASGYGPGWALAMSLFIYAGSMEFVGIGLLTGGASLLTAALTTLMVNARHLFYGISMVDRYRDAGRRKPYMIFALTDETYSLVCRNPEELGLRSAGQIAEGNSLRSDQTPDQNPLRSDQTPDQNSLTADYHRYCFLLSLFNQIYWVTGSVTGAFLGNIIPFSTEGIDFALTALFITVFVDQWLSEKRHFPAILGVVATVVCLILCGPDSFLIPSMAVIAVVLCLKRNGQNRFAVKLNGNNQNRSETKPEERDRNCPKMKQEANTLNPYEVQLETNYRVQSEKAPKTQARNMVLKQREFTEVQPEGRSDDR